MLRPEPDLGLCWLESTGVASVEYVAEVLKITGFFAQTEVLVSAEDVEDPESVDALLTALGMTMDWDESWTALVRRHWANSPEAQRLRISEALGGVASRCPVAEEPLAKLRNELVTEPG